MKTSVDNFIRPWLFLDVDGVVVPHGYTRKKGDNWQAPEPCQMVKIAHHKHGELVAHVPNRIIDLIHKLKLEYEIVWASTWSNLTIHLDKLLEVYSVDTLNVENDAGEITKGLVIAEFISHNNRRYAWVDDQLARFVFQTKVDPAPGMGLWLQPHAQEGLRADHTNTLLAWSRQDGEGQ